MPIGVKQDGSWQTPSGVFVRAAGQWQRAGWVYVRQDGEWRLVFEDVFAFNISGSLVDVNLRDAALAAGWNGVRRVIATVTSGSVLNASSNYALTINGSFPRGVTLINNGIIVGRGGVGGKGGDGRGDLQVANGGATGGAGGHGLLAQVPVTIFNNGIIAGGGGGGGGGGSTIANQFVSSGGGSEK
jgi:hypothetical protein